MLKRNGEIAALQQQNKELQQLQADTRETRAAAETALKTKPINPAGDNPTAPNGSGFELLGANY